MTIFSFLEIARDFGAPYQDVIQLADVIDAFGHPPAQIEDAAGDKDGQKPLDRWGDCVRFEMHNDGLAEDVGKAFFCNAIEARKDGRAKMDLRMPPSRFGQESF